MKMKVILTLVSHAEGISSELIPYLHCILHLGHDWTFRYEVEQLSLSHERHGNDQGHEEHHLQHQKNKHLVILAPLP